MVSRRRPTPYIRAVAGATYVHQGGAGLSSPLTLTQTYTYDGVNRLLSLVDNGYGRSFSYDPYGNMFVSYNSPNLPWSGNTPSSYVYSNNQFTTGSYDAAGNETSVNGDTVTYDVESRQTNVVGPGIDETYVYDGDGKRVRRCRQGNDDGVCLRCAGANGSGVFDCGGHTELRDVLPDSGSFRDSEDDYRPERKRRVAA